MRTRDLEDAAGIAQALEQQRMPVAQAAPGIAQAAGAQMGGGMNPDFVSYLQNIAQGSAPDFQQMYDIRKAMTAVPERGGEEFNLKNLFKFVADATAKAAEANAANPRGGLGSAFAAGSRGAYEKRENAHKEKHGGNKEILADLQKTAEEHRKFGLEKKKNEAALAQQSLKNDLIRAQTAKALRAPVGASGGTFFEKEEYKARQAEQKEMSKEQKKKLASYEEAANDASSTLGTLNEMQNLSGDFYQGAGASVLKSAGNLGSILGLDMGAPQAETFEALSSQLLLDLNTKLKGATSDKDVVLLRSAVPSINKTADANRMILDSYRAVYARVEQKAEAAQEYVAAHGTLEGFDSKWRKYTNSHPVLQKDEEGNIAINQENLENWRDQVVGGGERVGQDRQAPGMHELSDEDLDARIRQLEGK